MPRGNEENWTCPFTTSMIIIIILLNIFYLKRLCFDVYGQYAISEGRKDPQ